MEAGSCCKIWRGVGRLMLKELMVMVYGKLLLWGGMSSKGRTAEFSFGMTDDVVCIGSRCLGSLWERQNDRELRSWDVNFVRDFNE